MNEYTVDACYDDEEYEEPMIECPYYDETCPYCNEEGNCTMTLDEDVLYKECLDYAMYIEMNE